MLKWITETRSVLGRELSRTAAMTLGLRLVYVGLEFLCALALARICGASGYGAYAVVLSWVGVLAIPAAAGFDKSLVREAAVLSACGEWGLVRGLLRRSNEIAMLLSASLIALFCILLGMASRQNLTTTLYAGMLLVPLTAYARLRQAALQGVGRIIFGLLPEMLVQPLTLLCLIAAARQPLRDEHTGTLPVALNIASTIVACLVGVVLLRRSLPAAARTSRPSFRTGPWIRGALPFVWSLSMSIIITNSGTILLSLYVNESAAGVYRIASQVAMLVGFPLTAVNLTLAPRIAAMYARGDSGALPQVAAGAVRAIVLAAAPIALLLLLFGRPLLGMFGPVFQAGYPSLALLSLGYLLSSATGIAGYLLVMTAHAEAAALITACSAALTLIGACVLIPRWGVTGAAAATAFSLLCQAVAYTMLVYRKLGVQPTLLNFGASTAMRPTLSEDP